MSSDTPKKHASDVIRALMATGCFDPGAFNNEAAEIIAAFLTAERGFALSVSKESDAERYRWLRDECDHARRSEIVSVSGNDPSMLDHHIDKGRCGL